MSDDPEMTPVMRVVDSDGAVYYMHGSDEDEVVESFGEYCDIEHGYFTPLTNKEDQNG